MIKCIPSKLINKFYHDQEIFGKEDHKGYYLELVDRYEIKTMISLLDTSYGISVDKIEYQSEEKLIAFILKYS